MNRKLAIVGGLIFLVVISLFAILEAKFSVVGKLPAGVIIVNQYRDSGFGNGDSSFGFKAVANEKQYAEFCQRIGVPLVSDPDGNEIGYFPSTGDFPEKERNWWDEPRSPRLKSFLKAKRGFKRVSYSNGFIYYFSRTW
jgi:hypothetical protein